MAKILFLADSPPIGGHCTGFGRVARHIGYVLAEMGEVTQIAINFYGADPDWENPYPWRFLSTSPQDPLGYQMLELVIKLHDWDLVLGFNDLWVTNIWYRIITGVARSVGKEPPQFYGYFPIDARGIPSAMAGQLEQYAGVATYTEWGRSELRKAGYRGPCTVIPHGVEPVEPVQRDRTWLQAYSNSWIVFRADVNRDRKRYDLTIRAFAQFCQGKPVPPEDRAPILFLHAGDPCDDLPIQEYYAAVMREFGQDPKQRPLLTTAEGRGHPFAAEETLRKFYASADVYLQTTDAEGWGLCAIEAAQYGVPVILGRHSVHSEIWGNTACFVEPISWRGQSLSIHTLAPNPDGAGSILQTQAIALTYPVCLAEDYATALDQLWQRPMLCQTLSIAAQTRWQDPAVQWPMVERQFRVWVSGVIPHAV